MAKVKFQITMEEELLEKLNDYCDRNYVNRSILISQAVVEVINRQKIIDAIMNVSLALKKSADTGHLDDETRKEIEGFEALSKMFVK